MARPAISRDTDRRITFVGVLLTAGLLAAAVASIALPAAARHGLWLPLHLALAGAAGTAIAAVLPFFTAALAVARPAHPAIRAGAVALVAGGALVVSVAVVRGSTGFAVIGGSAYLLGLGAVAVAAFAPLRKAFGPRRRLVELAYAAAIVQVAAGAGLATAMLAGVAPVVERWALLKPAHVWLNVFGFVSVVVAASLLHLAPTVAGSRIRPRRTAQVAVTGLAVGAPIIALGFALGIDALARIGAAIELVGAAGLVAHGLAVQRDRGRWTTDAAWHRFTGWSLAVAPAWFLVAVGVAAGRVLRLGAAPAAWSIELVAAPLAVGWLVQVLIGSWTHLVPAIGPGDQPRHARQRAVLGRAAVPRIIALNAGVIAIMAGVASGSTVVVALGAASSALAVGAAVILLAIAGSGPSLLRVQAQRGH